MAPGSADRFDVLVLGAGSGGYACALRAAQLGLSVGLVERDRLGGTCLHQGCIPTKALLHAAEIADAARDSERFGIRATLDGVDMALVNAYLHQVVDRLHRGLTGLVKSRGITQLAGSGRLVAADAVEVDGTTYSARHVVLATGSHARTLPGLEVDGDRVLTSDHALRLDEVPESVVVVGGGVIGCEFASIWRSFGAQVTVVEALPRLLAAEDEASSTALERAFRKRGITVRTGASFQALKHTEHGVGVVVADGDLIEAERVLVAVGRAPTTADLGCDEVGVELDRGFVRTDDRLRTSAPGMYAVGDVVAGLQLAHRGFAHGVFVAEDIAGLGPSPVDEAAVPRITYSHPEVASVGLTEAAAIERFGADGCQSLTYDLAGNGRSQILASSGFVKVVRRTEGPVLGVHMVGARVGELLGEAQLIYGWEAHPEDVAPFLHSHPTQHEALGEAHLALAGKPLHVHG